ncbi:hypothetical protein NDU88_002502 [Pleurodeles waltl]|uniref:Uncharacterized protein n=1 Tax=Pleurodeles waltl TaxID=8319 RepID=A0AAV7WQD4_PLEWA|nr:hypothetical protein NDU88_002502 [Pleurodeles waltl]
MPAALLVKKMVSLRPGTQLRVSPAVDEELRSGEAWPDGAGAAGAGRRARLPGRPTIWLVKEVVVLLPYSRLWVAPDCSGWTWAVQRHVQRGCFVDQRQHAEEKSFGP